MIKAQKLLILIWLLSGYSSFAQLGGTAVNRFLDLPYSARTAALGGNFVPIWDKDLSLALSNPSLLNDKMSHSATFNITNYLSDVSFGAVGYARKFGQYMTSANIEYIDYGDFVRADEYGNKYGGFRAGEYALNFSAARPLNDIYTTGATLKVILSSYEHYSATALATDLAASWHSENELTTASVLINNLGLQLKPFTKGNPEPLPLNIQAGFSEKLEHMPLRFIVVAHHLNKPDFTYYNPESKNSIFGNETNSGEPLSEKIFRHFNFGGELVLSENLFIRFGYSHQRRKEMLLMNYRGLTGYSWGFGLRIYKFSISYGNAIYHAAGASNQFSVTTNFGDFRKKTD